MFSAYKKVLATLGISLLVACTPPSSKPLIEQYAQGDVKGVLEDLQRAAGRKDVAALYFLAYIYDTGDGVKRDAAKANNLYMSAASLGLPRAQAIMYVLQLSDKKNRQVEQIIPALEQLGKQDPDGSMRWYCEGLHNLSIDGEYDVSSDFLACLDSLKSIDEASANRLLASAYFGGIAVKKDDVKGVEAAKKAVVAGDLRTLSLLASAYRNGLGTSRDLKRAYAYAQSSLSIGTQYMSVSRTTEMEKMRDELAKRFSAAELKEAQSLAEKIQSESRSAHAAWRQKYLFAWALQ